MPEQEKTFTLFAHSVSCYIEGITYGNPFNYDHIIFVGITDFSDMYRIG